MASVILTQDQIIKAIVQYIADHELLTSDGRQATFRFGGHNGEIMVEVKEVEP